MTNISHKGHSNGMLKLKNGFFRPRLHWKLAEEVVISTVSVIKPACNKA